MKSRDFSIFDTLFRERGAATALIVPGGRSLSYAQLRSCSLRLADSLEFGADARLAVALTNLPEFVVVLFAAAFRGLPLMPLNPALMAPQIQSVLAGRKASALITRADNAQSLGAAGNLGLPCFAVASSLASLQALPGNACKPAGGNTAGASPNSIALLLQTSGTTGQAKWVPLTQRNLMASVEHITGTYRLTQEDATLLVMPLFHVHGLVAGLLATLASGGRVIMPPTFSAHAFMGWLSEEAPTWYTAVPTIHQIVLGLPGQAANRRGRLRFIRSCSSPLAAATMAQLETRFDIPVLQAYGMTEAAHQVSSSPLPPGVRKPGGVGMGTGVEIAILDKDGNFLPHGRVGEVAIRGENVMIGYLDNSAANARSFTNGFLRTGDIGRLDGESHLFLLGRLKELINRGGEKISPVEIDYVLLEVPGVAQAVSFGVPDAIYGETVHAAVVSRGTLTAEELIRHCREKLPAFMVPVQIHLLEALPTGPSGKVARSALPELLGLK